MKKISTVLFAVAAMFSVACQEEEFSPINEEPVYNGEPVLTATIGQYGAQTRTVIDTSYQVWWQSTDEIVVEGTVMTCKPNPDSLRLADFYFKEQGVNRQFNGKSRGYYPASMYKDGKLTLPDSLVYKFDAQTNRPSIAFSPMAGYVYKKNIDFMNCCGLLEFSATGTATITKIYVSDSESGTSGALVPAKALCGEFTVKDTVAVLTAEALATGKGIILDCGNGVTLNSTEPTKFYLTIPAGTYGDLRMAYYDNNGQVCIQDAGAVTIERNNVYVTPDQTPVFKAPKSYFCIKSVDPATKGAPQGSTKIKMQNFQSAPAVDLKYSIDGGVTWKTLVVGQEEITLFNVGDSALFKAGPNGNKAFGSESGANMFSVSGGKVAVSGNITYLLNPKGVLNAGDTLVANGFKDLFSSSNIVDASGLELPSSNLKPYCFANMFDGCQDLVSVPSLPATDLAPYCYTYMFKGCTALETAPALPANVMKEGCYKYMFDGCTSLDETPTLGATTLAKDCYMAMFRGCTGLKKACDLPATELKKACYYSMFERCDSLTVAPAIAATTVAEQSCEDMFKNCKQLETAPELKATQTAPECYSGMFMGCESLKKAPTLLAETLESKCYSQMFMGCTSLDSLACYAVSPITTNTVGSMISGSAQGFKLTNVDGTQPSWAAAEIGNTIATTYPVASPCFAYKAGAQGATVAMLLPVGRSLQYSLNAVVWHDVVSSNPINLPASMSLWVKAKTTNASLEGSRFGVTAGSASLTGDVMYLLNGTTPATTAPANVFIGLFSGNDKITDISELNLSATTLSTYCYKEMFKGCTMVTKAPTLPAVNLAEGCYQSMFQNCSKLDSVTCLAGDAMIKDCVKDMVSGCAAGGTLVRSNLSEWAIALPSNWTVKDTLGNVCTEYCNFDGVGYYGCIIGNLEWAPVNCGFDPTVDAKRTSDLKTYKNATYNVKKAPYGLVYQWGRKTGACYYHEFDANVNKNYLQTYSTALITSSSGLPTMAQAAAHSIPYIRAFWSKKGKSWWCKDYYNYDSWQSEYDPCPDGWHVPKDSEFQALFDQGYSDIVESAREGGEYYNNYQQKTTYKQVGRYFGKSGESVGVFLGGYGHFPVNTASGGTYTIASSPMALTSLSGNTKWRYWSSEKGMSETWGHSLMLFSINNEYKPALNDDREAASSYHSYGMSAANSVRCVRKRN